MRLHIGQSRLRGDLSRYARGFDLLELRAEPGRIPRPAGLRRWAEQAPAGFVFSVVLPRRVAALEPSAEQERELESALRAADALGATWLVAQTPASVTPTERARRRLGELSERLPRDGRRIAWEPQGLWEDEESERLAERLGLHLVRDLSRSVAAPGDVAYTRVRTWGESARLGAVRAQRVAERLVGHSEAFVVLETPGAAQGARALREAVAEWEHDGFDEDEIDEGEG